MALLVLAACNGRDSAQELPEPSSSEPSASEALPGRRGGATIVRIAAGGGHSLAVGADGTVWSWGLNSDGQLGQPPGREVPFPTPIAGLGEVTEVAAGGLHSLFLTAGREVWAAGYDGDGRLGGGGTVRQHRPRRLTMPPVLAVAAGDDHSLALRADGTVIAWGANHVGQLGGGGFARAAGPVAASGPRGVMALASRGGFSLALAADGSLWAWGHNAYATLGNRAVPSGPRTLAAAGPGPRRRSPAPVRASLQRVAAVAAGSKHALAALVDGTVWGWGANRGQALGGEDGAAVFVDPLPIAGLERIVAVAAGDEYSLALDAEGGVWAWGSNDLGRLGIGADRSAASARPLRVAGLPAIAAIAAGPDHALALDRSGRLWGWGSNFRGQLGSWEAGESAGRPVAVAFPRAANPPSG